MVELNKFRPPAPAREAAIETFDDDEYEVVLQIQPRFYVFLFCLLAIVLLPLWWWNRQGTGIALPAPALTPARQTSILAALYSGWPQQRPWLVTQDGRIPAAAGRIDAIAAMKTNGAAVWGVAYAWLGPADASGARAIAPHFAIVSAGDAPKRLYEAPSMGGWNGSQDALFNAVSDATARVDAISLGKDGEGFLAHTTLETDSGGRITQGKARLYIPGDKHWSLAWEGLTDNGTSSSPADEISRSWDIQIQDAFHDGHSAIVSLPSVYERRLDGARGSARHFLASGPGPLVYKRVGDRYRLAGIESDYGNSVILIREAMPILAVRTEHPPRIDGRFNDWESHPLSAITGMALVDPTLIKYKRRNRRGVDDCSGDIQLMWDLDNLYLRASVLDDHVVSGPVGSDLYKGDHVGLWLDTDLAGDFSSDRLTPHDWQFGLTPGVGAILAHAYCWIPKPGFAGIRVASSPHVDSYSGKVLGYDLEAAIPWAKLGGLPKGTHPGAVPRDEAPGRQVKNYHLRLAGVAGIALELSDTDKEPQELTYVSSPGFGWSKPKTFNTLLLVEGQPAR